MSAQSSIQTLTPEAIEMRERLRTDLTTRAAYISDASIFRRVPQAVLEVRSEADIALGIEYAKAEGLSITSRGGGTSVAGNAIGEGLVLDTSRYFNKILDIDPEAKTARIQPGVICDQLRDAAAQYGLTYGPDPSTHSRCTVGGMVANNACGSHSLAWGTAADNVVSMKIMLGDGSVVEVNADGTNSDELDGKLKALRDANLKELRTELGRFARQVSGYGMHYLLPENGFNVAKALAGSEGTLGVITELVVRLVEKPKHTALAVLAFETVFDAAAAAASLRRPGLATAEGMGGDLLDALRSRPGQQSAGSNLPGMGAANRGGVAKAGGWLFCETAGQTIEQARSIADELVQSAYDAAAGAAIDAVVVTDHAEARTLWKIREASAGIVTRLPDGGEAWPSWEDSAVPPENLAGYLRDLYALMDAHGLRGIPFGHFGEGCVHVRISFDLGTNEGVAIFRQFMEQAADTVAKHGGSLSGEHGDGRARSELLTRMYSSKMMKAFASFKAAFDPEGLFNPGVLVNPERIDESLRPGPGQRSFELTPVHALSRDKGSLVNAVNRCVGVGLCRSDEGAMCPSFQGTHDEVNSTRGRARVLSEMFRGTTLPDAYKSEEVKDALDLCLSCKACASECPVNVDMATYKSEFLHKFYEGRIRPMAHYTMGWLPKLTHWMHKVPGAASLANTVLRIDAVQRLVKKVGGIEPTRKMITFSGESLQRWAAKRKETEAESPQGTVVLWPDSFNNHLDTGPGQAAVEVLETLGYRVIIPEGFVCCGLTWHSTGQLDTARKVIKHTLDVMEPLVKAGYPVIGLEPSCTVMLGHEITELVPEDPRAAALSAAVVPFADLIAKHVPADGKPSAGWPFEQLNVGAVSQVHCHERSQGDHGSSSAVLRSIGIDEREIETGCCGLAGNWGFEPGHAELSRSLGERELFPAIRNRAQDDVVLADGFSCRTQIAEGTEARGMHLAQVLLKARITG